MKPETSDFVVPVIAEEAYVDIVPVSTGGVRIIKGLETHQELIEQQLRSENVEVTRVAVNRTVDGPQNVTQLADGGLIIPIVQEILKIERSWVVTEEIHVTKTQKVTNHQETVTLQRETVKVERFEAAG